MRGFTLIETLAAVCILAILIAIGIGTASALVNYREAQEQATASVLRQVAIDRLYETHALSADEIWQAAAKAELSRRGLPGPVELNQQTLAVYLDATGPYDPPFVVPNRYDPLTIQALGLTEPE